MKIKILILSLMLAFSLNGIAQKVNKKYQDPKLEKEVLVGYCNIEGMEEGVFGVYFRTQHETYHPKSSITNKIKTILSQGNYKIVTVFGDWCSDSKLQMGRFYKVLEYAEVPATKMTWIGVDGSKKVEGMDISEYQILRVPTFIVYLNDKEIGRIVESPKFTLEKDLYSILKSVK